MRVGQADTLGEHLGVEGVRVGLVVHPAVPAQPLRHRVGDDLAPSLQLARVQQTRHGQESVAAVPCDLLSGEGVLHDRGFYATLGTGQHEPRVHGGAVPGVWPKDGHP